MYLTENEPDELETMAADVERCGELLATANVDVLAYGCTTGSLVKGSGYDEEIERRLEETTGIVSVATAASIKRAFDALGVDRIAIATPYEQELDERERRFLEDAGYDVAEIRGLGIRMNTEVGAQPPMRSYRQASDLFKRLSDAVDAIFISCTNYRTFETIPLLEEDTGVPVVTSNQATLWDALRRANVSTTGLELGRLFE
jgi:maleate isomerase